MPSRQEAHQLTVTHQDSGLPSNEDIKGVSHSCFKYGLIASHDGSVIKYYTTGKVDIQMASLIIDKMQKARYDHKQAEYAKQLKRLRDYNVVIEVIE